MVFRKKFLIYILLALALASLVSFLATADVLKIWQIKLSDRLQASRPLSNDIVIVAVDGTSVDADAGLGPYENWNYDNFVKVLENINKYNPRAVAFDFFFRNSKEGDIRFRDVLATTKNPIMFYRMNPSTDNQKGFFEQMESYIANPLPLQIFRELPNIIIATSFVLRDEDQSVRRIMPFIVDEKSGQYYENFPFAIARVALAAMDKPDSPLMSDQVYHLQFKDGNDMGIPLENGQMIINFASIPIIKTYSRISFIDVYKENYANNGNNPEKLFKDKIVLIGLSTVFQDSYSTPVNVSYPMNGVEIHANALQTILDRAFLRNMTLPEKVALIFALALLSSFVFMYTRIRWSLLYLVAVSTGYAFLAPVLFDHGVIVDLVHPYLALAGAFVSVYMYRYVTEFREKRELKGAFSKYVNPAIVNEIMAHPEKLKLGGEKRLVTVIFTDIKGFTSISESLNPESVITLLNEYLTAMSAVILAEGGTVDKYIGDAIMAIFGAPIQQPDHAICAATAALKMRNTLNELQEKWNKNIPPLPGGEQWPKIDFRCGLSTGAAIVGNAGSPSHLEYTAIGDTVNLGSRLEGANKKYGTKILVSEETWNATGGAFVGRVIDVIRVVGKTHPVKIHEILAGKEQITSQTADLLRKYDEGVNLYHERKFAEGLAKFEEILKAFPDDGPSKMYRQRCEVLRDFPPAANWDGVYEMGEK